MKPLGFSDYNALQMNALPSSLIVELSAKSLPSSISGVEHQGCHERPEAMEEASVIMVGLNPERILQGLQQLLSQTAGSERNFRQVSDYSMPMCQIRWSEIILSYTDYIKRVVWSEHLL
jgi:UDP-N-acetylglucosamine 2-epimerase (non-hydrolysing)